ncbi:MAG: DUF6599 family protein [Acidobacteriota bacterium]
MAKKVRPRRKNPVFNDFGRRKLLRKSIPTVEIGASLACLAFLVVAGGWTLSQRDNYDPGERDLDIALLDTEPKQLYTRPLARWRDPSQPIAETRLDIAPFPDELVEGGWAPASRVQTFTNDNLYEKINGQAEQYVKFGFRELSFLILEEPSGESVDLFLYDQARFENALGLFAEQRGSKPLLTRGDLLYTPTGIGAIGMLGHHVFHLIGSGANDVVMSKTEQVLDSLSGLAEASPAPAPFKVLTQGLGLPLDRVHYTPINAFQLGFAQRFWFGRTTDEGTSRVFVHWAESDDAASTMFQKLHDAQQGELELVTPGESERHYRHAFLGTHYALGVAGPLVYGLEDHPDPDQAVTEVARLKEIVTTSELGVRPGVPSSPSVVPTPAPPAPVASQSDESEGDYGDYGEEEG